MASKTGWGFSVIFRGNTCLFFQSAEAAASAVWSNSIARRSHPPWSKQTGWLGVSSTTIPFLKEVLQLTFHLKPEFLRQETIYVAPLNLFTCSSPHPHLRSLISFYALLCHSLASFPRQSIPARRIWLLSGEGRRNVRDSFKYYEMLRQVRHYWKQKAVLNL